MSLIAGARRYVAARQVPRPSRPLITSIVPRARASAELLALSGLTKEADHLLAREWVDNFKPDDVPKDAYQVARSRSSGPGGQHVNKTESKVTIRCDLTQAKGSWLPPFAFGPLVRSPHYLASPPSLQISSQQSRTASQNLATAVSILHHTIQSAASSVIVNPTAPEQKQRVKGLIRKENERRLDGKKRLGAKKAARRDI
ncbi:hypothetical protein IAU60_002507 [Kwoniella sp. DSM 27419]